MVIFNSYVELPTRGYLMNEAVSFSRVDSTFICGYTMIYASIQLNMQVCRRSGSITTCPAEFGRNKLQPNLSEGNLVLIVQNQNLHMLV